MTDDDRHAVNLLRPHEQRIPGPVDLPARQA
jgi:hypothetical protein